MSDLLKSIAVEWANKLLSSRVDVTAGDAERFERSQRWKRNQMERLAGMATMATEVYLRRATAEGIATDRDQARADMLSAIAAEISEASAIQSSIDAAIWSEVKRP